MLKKLKKLNQKIEELTAPFNLKKKFPDYIRKYIFRFFLFIIAAIVIYEIFTYGIISYSVSCDSPIACRNPYWVCPDDREIPLVVIPDHTFNFITMEYCLDSVPDVVCKDVPCDLEYLQPGTYYGRDDLLFHHGKVLLFGLVLMAFITNHLWYMWRMKK